MTTCQKNLLRDFATPNELNILFAPNKYINQGNKVSSKPGSTIFGFLGLNPTLALALLLSNKKIFK